MSLVRELEKKDLKTILEIYNFYVKTSIATLDHSPINIKSFSANVKKNQQKFPVLVYEENNQVLAYTYASVWKEKHGYNRTVESTIYVSEKAIGKGIGVKLYAELIQRLKCEGYTSIIGCLSLPNSSSVALHEKLGFIKVAHFPEIAEKFNKKVSVGYWLLNT